MSFGETRLASPERAGVSTYNKVQVRPLHKRNWARVVLPTEP